MQESGSISQSCGVDLSWGLGGEKSEGFDTAIDQCKELTIHAQRITRSDQSTIFREQLANRSEITAGTSKQEFMYRGVG